MIAKTIVSGQFLALIAHLVISILLLWDIDAVIANCLTDGSTIDYRTRTLVELYLALAFIALEVIGLLIGITLFMPLQTLLSSGCHVCATLSLIYFSFESMECSSYSYVFGFCSVFPVVTALLSIFLLGKSGLFEQ